MIDCDFYMDMARRVAEKSYCVRRKVGAVLLTPDDVTLIGYNGTASGLDNICELDDGTTNPEVLHAEVNALAKALRAGISTKGATMFVTLQPCLDCAKMLYQAGVVNVVYSEDYRCNKGLDFLKKVGILVTKL